MTSKAALRRNGNTWQAVISLPTRSIRIGIGGRGKSRAEMQAVADSAQAQVDAELDLTNRPPLSDCGELWLSSREWSPRTLSGHTRVLCDLTESLGNPRGCDVKSIDLIRWRSAIIGCEATRCRQSRVVRALFGWLETAGIIEKSPARVLRTTAPTKPPEERYIPLDPVRLIEAADAHHRQCLALLAYAGLRLGEAHRLRWVDIGTDRITIRTERGIEGSKQAHRVCRLDPELKRILVGADRASPPHGLREGASHRDIQRVIAQVAATINEPVTANSLRRWRAVSWHTKYPSHVVCAWLGHTEAVARSHYLKPTEEFYQ